MATRRDSKLILVADPESQTRSLVADVLRGAGFQEIIQCRDGRRLLERTEEYLPHIVITTSRLPEVSGLEYTRIIRAGYKTVPRNLSIIAMTDTPTKAFLEAARESGVDEMLVRPFTADAVLKRVDAVLRRPRKFIDSASYVGPDRRRRMLEDFQGPMRRLEDPVDGEEGVLPWESEPNRKVAREQIRKLTDLSRTWKPGDRQQLRKIRDAAKEIEATADATRDEVLLEASRSLLRYIVGVGAVPALDSEIVHTHIDAMTSLSYLSGAQDAQRRLVVDGLKAVVEKRLNRLRDTHKAVLASRV